MNDAKPQIVEKLKSANNILVAVSADPTVDQLTAAIALTLLMNKLKKNATAVFSGKIPHVIDFLKPKDTIQGTTDSLRDFIISLDKSKADKLRYKVEDDVVKIFITPYKASITEHDLKYSAGDFNIDLIIAIGVKHQQDLDVAITAHGRIFHDAVVMSINNSSGGDFGVANWENPEASSLSEQIAYLAADLGPSLLDEPIATALLTGIVAETSRFSNDKTHPKTMAISSTLLEAGANQQLVNYQLQEIIGTVVTLAAGTEIAPTKPFEPQNDTPVEEELVIDEDGSFKPKTTQDQTEPADEKSSDDANKPVEQTPPVEQLKPEPAQPQSEVTGESSVGPQNNFVLPNVAENEDGGAPVESTPTPFLDAPPIDAEADSARQAVETALAGAGSEVVSSPDASAIPQTPVLPDFSDQDVGGYQPLQSEPPTIQPITPNQPSYVNPSTTTQYTMPAVPEHEPAPLGMSPADQAFTMPMPPAGSAAVPQNSQFAPQPGPGAQPATDGSVPPPVPPPMPPPAFSGPRR